MAVQLTVDGREVKHPPPRPTILTDRQRAVLEDLRRNDGISTRLAGEVVHVVRGWCPQQAVRTDGSTCCERSTADGHKVLARLTELGLARHVGRGAWRPTDPRSTVSGDVRGNQAQHRGDPP